MTEIDGLKMDYEDGEEVEPPLEIPAHLKEICADMLVDEAEELLQKKWHFLGLWGEVKICVFIPIGCPINLLKNGFDW